MWGGLKYEKSNSMQLDKVFSRGTKRWGLFSGSQLGTTNIYENEPLMHFKMCYGILHYKRVSLLEANRS